MACVSVYRSVFGPTVLMVAQNSNACLSLLESILKYTMQCDANIWAVQSAKTGVLDQMIAAAA